ncbi:LCP family protein [Actinomadura sp. HBU206391]|uniref:LCP family protein n=1 Tax=Actinomadura sp. HBU206391 TaxID=2731692 RepID=UPI00164FE426|nr:LCP family protein [Actinomadura sp. HBU206391]MBC6456736.1 LCP family protein [Actinomadura sp. HBU206391]
MSESSKHGGGGPEGGEPNGGTAAETGSGPADQAAAESTPPGDGEAPPKKRSGRRRVLKWTAFSMVAILIAGAGAGYAYYRQLQGNIDKQDINGLLGQNRPKKQSKAVNILLIGSDSRAGENAAYGTLDGARADTTMLLHLSPGGDEAIGISFPRDLMVNIPSCKRKNSSATPAQFGMINSAFAFAGPSCTWQTIEELTQIHIDHFVVIDFVGFKQVVDALGGVEICLPRAINDRKARLNLPAGRQTVKGDAALGYVRTRTGGLGNGSDLDRIDRQKKFMSAVVQKAGSSDMLTDPGKFVRFLNAATKSISTDKDFSVGDMRKLAGSIKGMDAGGVRFVTVPFGAYAPDPNRVALDRAQAEPLFEAIRKDTKVPDPVPTPTTGKSAAEKSVNRSVLRVRVDNGAGPAAQAAEVADRLKAKRYRIVGTPGALRSGTAAKTRILYGAGAARNAATLAELVPGVKPQASKSVSAGVVYLILGKDWKGLKGQGPTGAREVRADQNICKGA